MECRDAAPSLIFYARDIFLDGFHRFRASDVAYVGQGKALVSRGIRAWQVLYPRHGGKFPGFYREKFRDTVKPRAVERRRICIDISGFRMRNTPTLTHRSLTGDFMARKTLGETGRHVHEDVILITNFITSDFITFAATGSSIVHLQLIHYIG